MLRRSGNADRLKRVPFIKRLGEASCLGRCPINHLAIELNDSRLNDRYGSIPLEGEVRRPRGRCSAANWCADGSSGSNHNSRPRRDKSQNPIQQSGGI
jgi:hypothetical protein